MTTTEEKTMNEQKYIPRVSGHALVLGGSGGIGYEVILALVTHGATAISFTYGKNKTKADEVVNELSKQGIKAYAEAVNQSDEVAFKQFLENAVTTNGEEISVAVNTIGISPNISFEDQTLDGENGWRNVFEVNVFGCFISTRALAQRMKAKQVKGVITLITSTNGINSQSSISAHYDASKAAQGMFMRIVAEEYAPDVRINGVAPGWINTKMNDTLPADERAKEMERIWVKRFADPKEVASFVAFVSGTGASYIYGQNLMIDGGYR
jgi:NAD(P)-dependent dehydrogenase (short-subunit alcohol dehydrogenase family)